MLATALVKKIRKRHMLWIPLSHYDNSAGISGTSKVSERDRVRMSEMHFVVLLMHSSLVFCETCGLVAFLISGEGTHWVHGRRSAFPDLPCNLAQSDLTKVRNDSIRSMNFVSFLGPTSGRSWDRPFMPSLFFWMMDKLVFKEVIVRYPWVRHLLGSNLKAYHSIINNFSRDSSYIHRFLHLYYVNL